MAAEISTLPQPSHSERPVKPAMLKGWRRRCPNCGEGALFDGYLTVRNDCDHCGQELHHHRADDGPAYLTILVVGHLMAPFLHITFSHFEPDPLSVAIGFSAACIALSLYLLPRFKGAMIGFQWAKGMGGFGTAT